MRPEEKTKPGMLWVDRVGDRRSRADPGATFFREQPRQAQQRRKRASTENRFTRATERRNNVKKRNETILNMNQCTLINLEGVGHDCNPSVAALRLYSHGRNDHSHRAGIDHPHRRNTHDETVLFFIQFPLQSLRRIQDMSANGESVQRITHGHYVFQ